MELADVDVYDRDTYVRGVPHDMFAFLRREAPVYRHPDPDGAFWAVTRHADVVTVNRDNQLFSSYRQGTLIDDFDPELLEQQRMMMLTMDPPLHTRYRLLVNKGFTPRQINSLEDTVRERANDIIDAVVEKGECDFVTDIAAELPLQVIADFMGVPQEDRHLVFDWSNRMVGAEDPEYNPNPDLAYSAAIELYAYAHDLAEKKRADPHEDIFSVLIGAEVEGHTLTELELDMFFLLLSVAGNETTRNLISHAQLALMENPDQRDKLVANPDLMPTAVEEMLRWGTPVMHFRRTATRDTEVGGQAIAEGDRVVMFYISANRDEQVFDEPYRFDIERTPNDHIAFGGGGPHFCLGANLARLEIRVMFEELVRRTPDMAISGDVQRLRSNFINGIKHLPVKFTPAAREGSASAA